MLKPKHLRALAKAVKEAKGWRGSLVGNPDPSPLKQFDKFIETAEEALLELRALRKKGGLNG